MEWQWILSFVLIGLFAGVFSGLLGISGGVIAVPSLLFVFRSLDIPSEYTMHVAVATSLSSMTFNSFTSMLAHQKKHAIVWDAALKMLPGLLVGSVSGAWFAKLLPSQMLVLIFGLFEICLGAYFMRAKKQNEEEHVLPSGLFLCATGFLIGGFATILGIGGGLLLTPLLVFLGFKMRKAVGTSASASFVVCFVGAISYLVLGLRSGEILPNCIGFIQFPAFLSIILTAPFAAIVGAHLTHELPVKLVKRIFGLVLMIAGVALLW